MGKDRDKKKKKNKKEIEIEMKKENDGEDEEGKEKIYPKFEFEVRIFENNCFHLKTLNPQSFNYQRINYSTVTLQNGDVFICGGYDKTTRKFIKTCEIYEKETKSLKKSIDLIICRGGHDTVLLSNGKVLISGGVSKNGIILRDAEVFDPCTNFMTLIKHFMHIGRYGHRTNILPNACILITGGMTRKSTLVKETEIFNLLTLTSHKHIIPPPMTVKRFMHSSINLLDGRIWFSGGEEAFSTTSTELYDVKLNIFYAGPDLNIPRMSHFTYLFPNGKIFIINGLSSQSKKNSEIFDPNTNIITKFTCILNYNLKYPYII